MEVLRIDDQIDLRIQLQTTFLSKSIYQKLTILRNTTIQAPPPPTPTPQKNKLYIKKHFV